MPGLRKTNPTIVAVCGSPHKQGNTATLLTMLFKELSGITSKIYFAYELNVHPCTGCGFCSKEFGCIFNDSMDEIYNALKECTVLIIASPLYFSHFPSPLKSIIDRCQPFWEYYNRNTIPLSDSWGMALLIGSGQYSTMFNPSIITLRHFFNSLHYQFDETRYLTLSGINCIDDIKNDDITKKIIVTAEYIQQLCI